MYRRILLAIDGSRSSLLALEQAVSLALVTHAEVCAMFVADDSDFFLEIAHFNRPALMADTIAYGKQVLAQAGRRLGAAGVRWSSRLAEESGSPARIAEAIIAQGDQWSADVIVMGTYGHRGVRGAILGSVSEHVVARTVRPVLLVRDRSDGDAL
ncbi:universal stress protein [Cupriavidus oxalaticus]|jgi:nucleotide-binding universal stress UspA family protein|uniref:Universal stress protein n=1 Tax=Cupriavidus oxalaticus TaxID=96344 RepID=A0A375FM05_9BURK|nr:universal stress protein [Cupriavidus oxalaticus]QRQ89001.1 universal stress protein [Cupriavidus oxalaticus]QRQ95924.1 universal stress protein [Cupriavidus oxalaticus]WQD84608.1 universal stress protein [Cupriavidus oxalaticus]SPC06450.1 Universal stress protein [Cupriavidus oxalaticus]SPC12566.1 Universal stress protein [Cupriavidus oxalaticus]